MSVYDELGVNTIVNAQGHMTDLGGSLMAPEVLAAMAGAASAFVRLDDLQQKVGERIARLIGVEACYVSSGAAAGLAIASAALIAGNDPSRIAQLPDTRGMKNEVIVQHSHRNGYDHAVRQVGARFVEIGGAAVAEMERAIGNQTAFAFYVNIFAWKGGIALKQYVEVAHRHGIPVLVDAAAELPPPDNLHALYDQGADLVVFSGGKELHGPQASGLVVGRRRFIEACLPNGNPHHSIGRSMKAGKEEIVGLYRAVERYISRDHAAAYVRRERFVETIVHAFPKHPGARASVAVERGIPVALISVEPTRTGFTAAELAGRLRAGDPPIYVAERTDAIVVNTRALQSQHVPLIVARFAEIFTPANARP